MSAFVHIRSINILSSLVNKSVPRRWVCPRITIRALSTDDKSPDKQPSEDTFSVWMLRFSHENNFLSWSRNAAICAGVGATLSIFDNQNTFGNVIGAGFMDLGLLFMTIGSLHHIASSYNLKHQAKISHLGFLWISTYTLGVWLLYFILIKPKLKEQYDSLTTP